MKKVLSILISIVMLLCVFASAMPSFALSAGNFTYELVDGMAVITGYKGSSKSFTVPATVGGVEVSAVSDGAFKDNTTITSVKVSEGVKSIGASAFENCTSLATISLPATVTHIGEKAIYNTAYYNDTTNWKIRKNYGNTSNGGGGVNIGGGSSDSAIGWDDIVSGEDIYASVLKYIYLGTNLIEIELAGLYTLRDDTTVIADGAFVGSTKAKTVILPDTLVTIGANAFKGCESLIEIRNIEVVDYIGSSAFENCISLKEIALPEKTIDIGKNAFYNTGLYNNSANWKNGSLYIKNHLICNDKVKGETTVPDGTVYIHGGALGSIDAIIPATVTEIHKNAFTDKSVVTIFGYADTYAQEYAKENNIKFVDLNALTKGDVDFNGVIDENDFEVLCSVASLQKYESCAISYAGDMNEDGAVDGLDAIILDLFLKEIGPSTIKGDANGDGKVNEADYDLLVKISFANEKIDNNFMFHRCDINGDGAVDSFDAMYLDLALNGLVALV